jgi:hypothetical protein
VVILVKRGQQALQQVPALFHFAGLNWYIFGGKIDAGYWCVKTSYVERVFDL